MDEYSTLPTLGAHMMQSQRSLETTKWGASRSTFSLIGGGKTPLVGPPVSMTQADDINSPSGSPARRGNDDPEKVKASADTEIEDPIKAAAIAERKARPVVLISSIASGLAAALAVILMSLGLRAYKIS